MNLRRSFFYAIVTVAIFTARVQNALAHAPFDCSARVIVHADSAEVLISLGATLGEHYLRLTQLAPAQLPNGHPFALSLAMSTNFFSVAADGKTLVPRSADGITDGLEFQFHFEYALAPTKSLRLQSHFLPVLPAPHAASLVLTDENGNLLASAILSSDKDAAEFALPAPSPPLGERVTEGRVRGPVANPPAEIIPVPEVKAKPALSFAEILKLGIGHILNVGAFDHLLFLLALLLGCHRLKPMLLVITGFTLAHSLTLALAALNVVTISSRVVEPLIAISIIFVAAENFRRTVFKQDEDGGWKMEDGIAAQRHSRSSILNLRSPDTRRYALTCGFGLIHGFGFASALRESGLGGKGMEIAKPLLAFNLGVEVGQLTVAAFVLPLLLLLGRWPWFARHGARMISALVILVAAFWLWQRVR